MRVDLSVLGQTARLTTKEIPVLEDEEWIEIKAVRDFVLDGEASTAAWADLRQQAEEANEDPPQQLPNTLLYRYWFEYMCVDWNLYTPAPEHAPLLKTKENRDKIFRLLGVYFTAELLKRGGGTAGPPVKEVGPDGEAPSLKKRAGKPAPR